MVVSPKQVSAAGSERGLTISPIRFEININPGESKSEKLKVSNFSKNAIDVNMSAEVFSVINPQYDYEFNNKSKTSKWIRFSEDNFNLPVGSTKNISFSLNVPNGAEPGGYYFSIFSSSNTESGDVEVMSKQRVASLIYVTVTGDITKKGQLKSLVTPWLINEKSIWSMSVQNTGTAHFRSGINVELYDIFGNRSGSVLHLDPLILPNTIRDISGLIPRPITPGLYKIFFYVDLGDNSNIKISRYAFFAPLWFIIVCFLSILMIIFFVVYLLKKHR